MALELCHQFRRALTLQMPTVRVSAESIIKGQQCWLQLFKRLVFGVCCYLNAAVVRHWVLYIPIFPGCIMILEREHCYMYYIHVYQLKRDLGLKPGLFMSLTMISRLDLSVAFCLLFLPFLTISLQVIIHRIARVSSLKYRSEQVLKLFSGFPLLLILN